MAFEIDDVLGLKTVLKHHGAGPFGEAPEAPVR